jgi:ubiquinone/menaquinone biosynthesis C-methylase UbiE
MTATHASTTNAPDQREQWNALAPGFDEHVTPVTIDLGRQALDIAGLRPGERFLDVAAGSGALAVPAAQLGAEVVAVDYAEEFVARVRERAQREGLANLAAQVMDGMALTFPDGRFDVAGSQNGVTLFPDIGGGLRELVRVVRPSGRVVLVAFGDPREAEFVSFAISALRAVVPGFPGLPTDPPPLPFQVADPAVFRTRLVEAGLEDVEVHTTRWSARFPSADAYLRAFASSNPIGAQLLAGLDAQQSSDLRHVLDGMFRERSGGAAAAELHTTANIAVGTKPPAGARG